VTRRVLVTGASGFVGKRVVPLLVARGDTVVALARSDRAAELVRSLGATPVQGDLDDADGLVAAFASADASHLLNIASLGFGHGPAIVRAAESAGCTRAVFVSTTAITTSLPAQSKRVRVAAEEAITRSSLRWTIVRPTMIYGGADDRNMHRLLAILRRTPVLPLPGGGRRLQQPVHVEDLAAALVAALDADVAIGKTYDVAGPSPLTLRVLVETAATAVGRAPRLVPLPLTPAIAAARLYERVVARPRLKAEQLERLAEDKAFDIGAAERDLGYAPRSFEEGIAAEAAESWPT
jgi:uncharacterized protein YbjT (DUF2867 family)